MRSKYQEPGSSVQNDSGEDVDRSQGAARAISSFIDPGLSWKDIPWFQVRKLGLEVSSSRSMRDPLSQTTTRA